jgi:hypothetical protein
MVNRSYYYTLDICVIYIWDMDSNNDGTRADPARTGSKEGGKPSLASPT